jgi:predicted ATPase
MEDRPLITRVVLENYKSIAFCDVKLGPLSILVGPNGAGKSNFLDALRFLSKLAYAPLASAIQERGGFLRLCYRGGPVAGSLGFRIEFKETAAEGHYSLRAMEDEEAGSSFGREGSSIRRNLNKSHFDTAQSLNGDKSHLRLLREPEFDIVLELIRRFRFYHFNPRILRTPAHSSPEDLLSSDGSNLPNVLHHILERRRPVYERINQYLRVVNPSIALVEAREVLGYRTLFFKPTEAMPPDFDSSQMSDGTLTSLAILVALFQRQAGAAVDLVGLEEPESALHPAAAGALFDAMNEASSSVQVLATTHSADLLDNKEVDTGAILAVELHEGATRIGHVDETGRQAVRDRLYTAGELMRMNYLRPEVNRAPDPREIESILFGGPVPA